MVMIVVDGAVADLSLPVADTGLSGRALVV
jgi:hypothetical protein